MMKGLSFYVAKLIFVVVTNCKLLNCIYSIFTILRNLKTFFLKPPKKKSAKAKLPVSSYFDL